VLATSSFEDPMPTRNKAFPYPMQKDQQQAALSSIPWPLFYPAMAACVSAVGAAGFGAGKALPVEPENKSIASFATAAVGAAAAAAVCVQAKKKRDTAAVVDLYNVVVELPDPSELTPQAVDEVGSKYGMKMQKDDLEGLRKIYGQYLETLIPSGDRQLKGDEAAKVSSFKTALGLSDEDAAPVHVEVARRLFRQGYETKDRAQQFEQRKAFQRLIYVSQLVFGDQKAAFLLPWRRHFNITDAQVFVARRDNAKTIFKAIMEREGNELRADRHFLRTLRDHQVAVKMMDESAVELVREFARKHVEARLVKALTQVKLVVTSRDSSVIMDEVSAALDYSRKLAKYANEEDLIPGLGFVTLAGGQLLETRARDLKELYKNYIEQRLESTGEFTPAIEADVHDLQQMIKMPQKEAHMLHDEVAARLYKRLLREAVTSGKLDSSESPAEVLGSLCERLRFSPEAALELHRSLYKAKLASLLSDKPKLSDENEAELARIRRLLCLPTDAARKASRETAGRILEEAISDIYMMGAKPVMETDLNRIEQIIKDVRLDQEVALDVFQSVTRERLRSYIQQAQKERSDGDRKEETAAIKRLVQFNAIVVTPLLDRVKGLEAGKKELAELLMKAQENAKAEGAEGPPPSVSEAAAEAGKSNSISEVQKAIQAARGEFGDDEKKGQKEITLKDDVPSEARALLYRDYLMSTMSGEVVNLPVGGVIRKKTNEGARQADMARLQSLADILGMDQMEISKVHGNLSEEAYKAQATQVMRSGPPSKASNQLLDSLAQQLGLNKEAAEKINRAVRTEVYGSEAIKEEGGQWSIERVKEIVKEGGKVEDMADEVVLRNLYRKELEKKVTDGSGEAEGSYFHEELPKMLGLNDTKVRLITKELVGSRKRMMLVQAVSQFRQKRPQEVSASLNNLISCLRVLPEDKPLSWTEPQELRDMYATFCMREKDGRKRSELASSLGISPEEASKLEIGEGTSSMSSAEEEESIF